MSTSLRPFFKPTGVAVIGASSNPGKLSHGIFRNLAAYGFNGGVYPVNPNASEILGFPCYPDVASVPDLVELAVSVVPAASTPQVLDACGQRGIRAVTIISGGFREVGAEGLALENRCVAIARSYGMRLVGPNGVGTMDLNSRLDTTFIAGVPEQGGIAFLSQSGAICGGIVDIVRARRIGFSAFVSLGNMADVSETDMLEYFAADPDTKIITLYLEGLRDGKRFMEVARRVTPTKPVLVLKAGRTEAGGKAVSSHTGSIAGSHTAYQTAFRQCGVIEVDRVQELFDLAFALEHQPIPAGKHAALVTNAGGPAALVSDSLGQNGFRLGAISPRGQVALREQLVPSAQVGNPVDMLGGATPEEFETALTVLAGEKNIDVLIPILVPQSLVNPAEVAQSIVRATEGSGKTVLASFMGDSLIRVARQILHGAGIPLLDQPDAVGRILQGMAERSGRTPVTPEATAPTVSSVRRIELPDTAQLGEVETRRIFAAYDIPQPKAVLVHSADECRAAAENLQAPLVLKIVSADILHKSDSGGVILNIPDPDQAGESFSRMLETVQRNQPQARLDGALLAEMAPKGSEWIVGMRRDPVFGPIMMVGMGGIYVELFQDVSFRIPPITRDEARQMLQETKGGKLLAGYRGGEALDAEAMVEVILKLAEISLAYPEIEEIEINPLVVYPQGSGVLALDGRAILRKGDA